jgi:hypothetical protein
MSVPAQVGNLAMFIGEDKIFQDVIYQNDGVTPEDISNWEINFTVQKYGNPATVFIFKSVGNGIQITDPNGGVASIFIDHIDTIGMLPDQYEYVIERVNPGGDAVPTLGLFTLRAKTTAE